MDNLNVGSMPESENKHIIPDFVSTKLISGYDVILAVNDPEPEDGQDDTDYHVVAFLNSHNNAVGRPLQQVGELGSNALFTIVMESQKNITLNRLLVKRNVLREMYYKHIENGRVQGEILNSKIWIDLDNPVFDLPINIKMYFYDNVHDTDEESRSIIAKVLLKNAYISNFSQPSRQGQGMIMESISLTWEETIEEPLE